MRTARARPRLVRTARASARNRSADNVPAVPPTNRERQCTPHALSSTALRAPPASARPIQPAACSRWVLLLRWNRPCAGSTLRPPICGAPWPATPGTAIPIPLWRRSLWAFCFPWKRARPGAHCPQPTWARCEKPGHLPFRPGRRLLQRHAAAPLGAVERGPAAFRAYGAHGRAHPGSVSGLAGLSRGQLYGRAALRHGPSLAGLRRLNLINWVDRLKLVNAVLVALVIWHLLPGEDRDFPWAGYVLGTLAVLTAGLAGGAAQAAAPAALGVDPGRADSHGRGSDWHVVYARCRFSRLRARQ